MTDSEKLLAIVDKCKDIRARKVQDGKAELVKHGWGSELGNHFAQFDVAGAVLSIAGHEDELDWTRDVMGIGVSNAAPSGPSRIGGDMPC